MPPHCSVPILYLKNASLQTGWFSLTCALILHLSCCLWQLKCYLWMSIKISLCVGHSLGLAAPLCCTVLGRINVWGLFCFLKQMSMPIVSSRGDMESVRRCLAHSLFMSTAELQPDGTYATTDTHQPVAIHPSSVLFHCKPACVVYTALLYTNKCYMRDLCVVDAEWLYEAAPDYFRRKLRTARN